MSFRRTLLLASFLALPAVTEAQTCGGSSFMTCASVSITPTAITGGTRIVMTVTNNSFAQGSWSGTIFGAIGIFGLPSYNWSNFSYTGAGTWAFGGTGLTGSGIIKQVAGANFTGPGGITNGLEINESVTFTFDLDIAPTSINTNNWAIHGQNGPNGCSTKLVVTNGVANNGPYDSANCGVDPTTGIYSTPEPASMILLGTGLAGVGAAARRRRRQSA